MADWCAVSLAHVWWRVCDSIEAGKPVVVTRCQVVLGEPSPASSGSQEAADGSAAAASVAIVSRPRGATRGPHPPATMAAHDYARTKRLPRFLVATAATNVLVTAQLLAMCNSAAAITPAPAEAGDGNDGHESEGGSGGGSGSNSKGAADPTLVPSNEEQGAATLASVRCSRSTTLVVAFSCACQLRPLIVPNQVKALLRWWTTLPGKYGSDFLRKLRSGALCGTYRAAVVDHLRPSQCLRCVVAARRPSCAPGLPTPDGSAVQRVLVSFGTRPAAAPPVSGASALPWRSSCAVTLLTLAVTWPQRVAGDSGWTVPGRRAATVFGESARYVRPHGAGFGTPAAAEAWSLSGAPRRPLDTRMACVHRCHAPQRPSHVSGLLVSAA